MLIRQMILASAAAMFPLVAHADDSTLQGNWATACAPAADGSGTSTTNLANFANTQVTEGNIVYGDAACATPAYSVTVTASYALGTDTQVAGAQSLDLTISAVTATILNADYVAQFNQQKVCGIDNWAVNTPTDISGKACNGANAAPMPSAGTQLFDIVKSDASTDGKPELFFGDSSGTDDGSAQGKRPVAIDSTDVYHKS
jgi:hypothetical protein